MKRCLLTTNSTTRLSASLRFGFSSFSSRDEAEFKVGKCIFQVAHVTVDFTKMSFK